MSPPTLYIHTAQSSHKSVHCTALQLYVCTAVVPYNTPSPGSKSRPERSIRSPDERGPWWPAHPSTKASASSGCVCARALPLARRCQPATEPHVPRDGAPVRAGCQPCVHAPRLIPVMCVVVIGLRHFEMRSIDASSLETRLEHTRQVNGQRTMCS